jgi:hypothetical protein
MPEENSWDKYRTVEASVQALPTGLKTLLTRHEAALLCSNWLKQAHTMESLRQTAGDAVFQWDMVGMAFATTGRLSEAISIHRELYHLMCMAQESYGWIHKGLPLVRLRDWHKRLSHPWHEERYLLLTLIEDAIREEGKITPEKGGIYHRFRWEDGRPDAEFRDLSEACWKIFNDDVNLREFPEEILGRLGSKILKSPAVLMELDLYEINIVYASRLYRMASAKNWKALEKLATYELSCVPGFGVEAQTRTRASVFDVLVRLRGQFVDFRRELGTYLIGECKNWEEPVGTEAIAYLAQNLTFHECVAGVLFSWSGITGTGVTCSPKFSPAKTWLLRV